MWSGRASYERFEPDHLCIRRIFQFGHFKLVELTNYCFGALGAEIQFLYNKHGQVGRHMKVLGQINYILEGFFITDILSLANLGITVLGLLG